MSTRQQCQLLVRRRRALHVLFRTEEMRSGPNRSVVEQRTIQISKRRLILLDFCSLTRLPKGLKWSRLPSLEVLRYTLQPPYPDRPPMRVQVDSSATSRVYLVAVTTMARPRVVRRAGHFCSICTNATNLV